MAHTAALIAEERNETGTGIARALRRAGKIPGIIYGGDEAPRPIAIDAKTVTAETRKAGFFSRIYDLELAPGKRSRVIARDVSFNPVTDEPLHIDFQRIDKDSKLNVSIPVEYINEDKAPGLKMGGMLNVIVHNLDVICAADSIPQKITIDLAGMNINQSVHLDSVTLPDGVKAANASRDNTLVTIVPPASDTDKPGEQAAS